LSISQHFENVVQISRRMKKRLGRVQLVLVLAAKPPSPPKVKADKTHSLRFFISTSTSIC